MTDYSQEQVPFQNILKGSSTKGYIEKIIGFLETYLPDFPNYFKSKNVFKASEEDISEYLYTYLQRKRRYNEEEIEYPFEFQPEVSQRQKLEKDSKKKGFKRRIDIGIRINTFDIDMQLIYCLEAKNLPTDKVGGEREKEYVVGNYGGINRFKMNQHGVNSSGDLIGRNGIVGYMYGSDVPYWLTQINEWIELDACWGNKELLRIKYISQIAVLESTHLRLNGDKLNLTHFWLTMN